MTVKRLWRGPMRRGLAAGAVAAASAGLPLGASLGPAMAASQAVHARHSAPVKYYIVRQAWHHQQEYLFEIAQRFLGNGNLYPEIFNLNKGRLEPGGQRLTNPVSIKAGWILELPASASGRGIRYGPLPTVTTHQPPVSNPAGVLVGSGIALFAIAAPGSVILTLRRRRQAAARPDDAAPRDAGFEPAWDPRPAPAHNPLPETAWTPPPAIPVSLEPERPDTASWWSATLEDDGPSYPGRR